MDRAIRGSPPARSVPIVGGDCNNGSRCGARYLNVNNAASIANWNVGASLSYPFMIYGGTRPPTMRPYFHTTR